MYSNDRTEIAAPALSQQGISATALHDSASITLRLLVVIPLLLVAAGTSLGIQRWTTQPLPDQTGAPASTDDQPGQVYFVDTEGWYRITENERAVISPYALDLASLPDSLPLQLGPWAGRELPLGPEIDEWFDQPEVASQREYRNPEGDIIWLSMFGSRGPKSFRLFEHTPATCYPLSGWRITREDQDFIRIKEGKIYVQRGFARNGTYRLVVLYLYLWDNPGRDPNDGTLSIRISAPILSDEATALRLLKEDFLPRIFTDVVPWHRF